MGVQLYVYGCMAVHIQVYGCMHMWTARSEVSCTCMAIHLYVHQGKTVWLYGCTPILTQPYTCTHTAIHMYSHSYHIVPYTYGHTPLSIPDIHLCAYSHMHTGVAVLVFLNKSCLAIHLYMYGCTPISVQPYTYRCTAVCTVHVWPYQPYVNVTDQIFPVHVQSYTCTQVRGKLYSCMAIHPYKYSCTAIHSYVHSHTHTAVQLYVCCCTHIHVWAGKFDLPHPHMCTAVHLYTYSCTTVCI